MKTMCKITNILDSADKFVEAGQMKLARVMAQNLIKADRTTIQQLAVVPANRTVLDDLTYLTMVYGDREFYQMRKLDNM